MRSMLHVLDKLVVMITYFEILSPYNIFISNCRNISLSGNTKCILNLSFFRKLLPIFLIFSRGLSFTNFSLSLFISFFKILTHRKQPHGHVKYSFTCCQISYAWTTLYSKVSKINSFPALFKTSPKYSLFIPL